MARMVLPAVNRATMWSLRKILTAYNNPVLVFDYLELYTGYAVMGVAALEGIAHVSGTILDNLSHNLQEIPSEDKARGVAIEKIAAQKLGHLGGNVSTIDIYENSGTKIAISVKTYDLSIEDPMTYEKTLISRVTSDIKELKKLETFGAVGTKTDGTAFRLAAGESQVNMLVAIVPEDKALATTSRSYLVAVRNACAAVEAAAEESRTIIVTSPMKGWKGKR